MGKKPQGSCQSASQRLPGDLLIPFWPPFRPARRHEDRAAIAGVAGGFEIRVVHMGLYSRFYPAPDPHQTPTRGHWLLANQALSGWLRLLWE